MLRDISIPLLIFTSLMPLLLILAHVLTCRLSSPEHASPQARLAKLIVVMNVLLLAGVWAVSQAEGWGAADAAGMLAFALIVFNGIAYSYFHFFNMSETARRIRMLIQIQQNGGEMRRENLIGAYTPENMVQARLERLAQMHQVSRSDDGRYRVASRFLITVAYMMEWVKRVLNLRRSATYR
ncbi:MAG: hypothetical protein EPN55_06950 [Gammaproteobacteria bacterium]|nr:MAG: hypothetical protein EPN55_06950 [Gammaproteobacteria bacterium]